MIKIGKKKNELGKLNDLQHAGWSLNAKRLQTYDKNRCRLWTLVGCMTKLNIDAEIICTHSSALSAVSLQDPIAHKGLGTNHDFQVMTRMALHSRTTLNYQIWCALVSWNCHVCSFMPMPSGLQIADNQGSYTKFDRQIRIVARSYYL